MRSGEFAASMPLAVQTPMAGPAAIVDQAAQLQHLLRHIGSILSIAVATLGADGRASVDGYAPRAIRRPEIDVLAPALTYDGRGRGEVIMLLRFIIGAAAALLSVFPAVAHSEPTECFDWAVVGRLDKQTFLGVPEASVDAVFQWEVQIREVVVGMGVPRKMTLATIAHTQLAPWAAQKVALFISSGSEGKPVLVRWGVLDRHLQRPGWRNAVIAQAEELGIAQCGTKR
jgi:hypothetical protein